MIAQAGFTILAVVFVLSPNADIMDVCYPDAFLLYFLNWIYKIDILKVRDQSVNDRKESQDKMGSSWTETERAGQKGSSVSLHS